MLTIFGYQITRYRGQILGWGLALALLGIYVIAFYDTAAAQSEQVLALMESLPPEMMALFGGAADFLSPSGYLETYVFSYFPLLLGIYAALAGSGLLAADEENGTLDLLMAYPVSRFRLLSGRLLALALALVLILGLTWLGFVIPLRTSSIEVTAPQLGPAFLSLLSVTLVYAAFGLLLSMLLPSRQLAASGGALLVVADYLINALANINPDLENIARLLPQGYYQGGAAVLDPNWGWTAGLLGAAALLALLSAALFQRRDIRVGGEGGWQLPGWLARRASSSRRATP